MKRTKQITIAIAVMMTVCVGKILAQEEMVNYQSKNNGVAVIVPSDTEIVKDEKTVLNLQSSNFIFSVNPLLAENLNEDVLEKILTETAAALSLDLETAGEADFKTNTLNGNYVYGAVEEDIFCIAGFASIKGDDSVIFLFTVNFSPAAADEVKALLKSFEYNPAEIAE